MDDFNQYNNELRNLSVIRVNTGLTKLDELLSGGIPTNSVILVSGSPGSGKTILCFHFLIQGLNNGENCLYLTSDERSEYNLKQAKELGFNFQQWSDRGKLRIFNLDLEKTDILKEIDEIIKTGNYTRIVLDSLTPVSEMVKNNNFSNENIPFENTQVMEKFQTDSISSIRMHIKRILNILGKENCTAMVTSEVLEGTRNLSRDTISEYLVDGIILMDLDMTMDRRKLTIRKMRATKHTLKPHDITIDTGGIKFL